MKEEKLIQLKKEIEQSKQQTDMLKGKLEYLKNDIKEEYGCDNVEELENLLSDMEKEKDKLDSQIKEIVFKIEEEYDV